MAKIKTFSLQRYVQEALHKAEYYKDENGVVVAKVPGAQGFFAQGDSFDEARENLREVIEGNILLALQVGLEIPRLEGITIEEKDVQISSSQT
jgi:predicted RNase H-like HicB family nuclease